MEDILVHGMDHEALFFAEGVQGVDQLGEGDGGLGDIGDHGHGEVGIDDVLGDVEDIDVVFEAFARNLGDDADLIGADDGDDCFHGVLL